MFDPASDHFSHLMECSVVRYLDLWLVFRGTSVVLNLYIKTISPVLGRVPLFARRIVFSFLVVVLRVADLASPVSCRVEVHVSFCLQLRMSKTFVFLASATDCCELLEHGYPRGFLTNLLHSVSSDYNILEMYVVALRVVQATMAYKGRGQRGANSNGGGNGNWYAGGGNNRRGRLLGRARLANQLVDFVDSIKRQGEAVQAIRSSFGGHRMAPPTGLSFVYYRMELQVDPVMAFKVFTCCSDWQPQRRHKLKPRRAIPAQIVGGAASTQLAFDNMLSHIGVFKGLTATVATSSDEIAAVSSQQAAFASTQNEILHAV